MFAKPYKLKSNNTLKNSEKKHLAQRIQNDFPGVTEHKVKDLVPVKSNSSCMKLVLHSGETIGVYVVDGIPIIIEKEEQLVPTVCALWKIPDLIPTITIHTPVLPKVLGGAPLYLPGVTLPPRGVGFPMFSRNTLLAACTSDNSAAAIVGRCLLSSGDMLLRAAGTCLETIHVYGDLLCKETKFEKIERPKLGPPSYGGTNPESITMDISQLSIQPSVKEEWPSLGKQTQQPDPVPVPNEPKLIPDVPQTETIENVENEDSIADECSLSEESSIPTDMDGLLQWCLLSFIKLESKRIELPLKTNLLYKNHLMPLCPADRTLDVKKSSYKKMGKFLENMQQQGLLEVREIEKGVDAVVSINAAHPLVAAHTVERRVERGGERSVERGGQRAGPAAPPLVREVHCVTAAVVDLFPEHKKGTPLTSFEVRATLTEYVKSRALAAPQHRAAVTLDARLANIVGRPEQEFIKWEELMSGVQNKMTSSTEMRFADGSVKLIKSKLEPIKMQVATRSGNKKVTLVSNLESFGFNLQVLSQECQHGVAASCGVTRSPGAKYDQLMLQGDQTHYVAKLLIEKYGLPKKFVEGADKALKKKKG
ncbi:eukaryotic translation initiation factor 2D [Galleria mellonella]|uniref:Eukaryotic translation initiation factor 2D n=1 Tax=Galleria mellonella TaxID=7137 RepID=A0A6J1WDI4_GALME|nr:eukaryotic translation initiation factor 2D [Galleria mellonella]